MCRKIDRILTDSEAQNEKLHLYLDMLKLSADLIDDIIPVFEKFDNKVYNARLDKALENVVSLKLEKCYVHLILNSNKFDLSLCFNHIDYSIWYKKVKWDNTIDGAVMYLPDGYYDIRLGYEYCSMPWDKSSEKYKSYYKPSRDHYFYIDSERSYNNIVQAEKIKKILLEYKARLLQNIVDLKKEEENIEETKKEIEDIKKRVDNFNSNTSCLIRDFYNLKSYATWQ